MEGIISALLDLGPLGIMLVLIVTGYLVPKPYYERELARADKATDAAEKNADALKSMTETTKTLTEEVKAVRADLRARN